MTVIMKARCLCESGPFGNIGIRCGSITKREDGLCEGCLHGHFGRFVRKLPLACLFEEVNDGRWISDDEPVLDRTVKG